LRAIEDALAKARELAQRKTTILKTINEQGLLTDELMELRVKGVMPRAQALHEVMRDNGVTTMAMICAICKAQFTKVLPQYGIDMDVVASVHQLVANAIVHKVGV